MEVVMVGLWRVAVVVMMVVACGGGGGDVGSVTW